MVTLTILWFACGLTLGARFKFFILIPTTVIAVLSCLMIDLDGSSWKLALAMLLMATATQSGYLLGCVGGGLLGRLTNRPRQLGVLRTIRFVP